LTRSKIGVGDIVSIIDVPERNGRIARVMALIKRSYVIEVVGTKELLKVQRFQIRKNSLHRLNKIATPEEFPLNTDSLKRLILT
jgi:hypothetical protein